MTHALHREGNLEDLKDDFTIIVRPEKGINAEGSHEKIIKCIDILEENNVVNYGIIVLGNKFEYTKEQIINAHKDGVSLYGVFSNKEDLTNYIKELAKHDLGLSVVIQGLYEEVKECAHEAGLKVHSTNHSMGIWGRVEKLPPEGIRKVTTMCGHGMISASLVTDIIENIKKNRMTIEEGIERLARQCTCGIFNTERARKLLQELICLESE